MLTDISADHKHIKELESAAFYDTLTGLYNREFGMKLMNEFMGKREKFIVVFVDMDKLKYVNDKFGHLEGDKYILAVAAILRGFSPSVSISRLGGDEFMLMDTGWDEQPAEMRMEELRAQLIQRGHDYGSQYEHSLSYGVIGVAEDNVLDASSLLAIADEKMYNYKLAHKMQRSN
jgi:diguanylate cyclase (GGDEF)-like protein